MCCASFWLHEDGGRAFRQLPGACRTGKAWRTGRMTQRVLIAGGGIGGLAAALSASKAGWHVGLHEQAPSFSEVGAGVQLGPNVLRLLHGWGLAPALERVAAFPERLQVRDALSGQELGVLPLGRRALQKYGAPYATLHRADLHGLLLRAVQLQGNASLALGSSVAGFTSCGQGVRLQIQAGSAPPAELSGDALVGADGLWSRVRGEMLGAAPPRLTGHLAYRALLPQTSLPAWLRSQQVTAWLGPRLHVVHYPVRGGEWLNLVTIVQGTVAGDVKDWDHSANGVDLQDATRGTAAMLRELIQAVTDGGNKTSPAWRLWALCDRPPMRGAFEQAQGRVALLGDAAHPMRPFLAQGAGMAIEDAAELGAQLAQARRPESDIAAALGRYALARWQRNARVQARSVRNGQIFHAEGLLRWTRNASMKLAGERLLDVPWLYGPASRAV